MRQNHGWEVGGSGSGRKAHERGKGRKSEVEGSPGAQTLSDDGRVEDVQEDRGAMMIKCGREKIKTGKYWSNLPIGAAAVS